MPSKKPIASKHTETPLAARDEAWIVEAWTIAGKLRAAGQRTKAERMEDAAERAQLAIDGLDVPRKTRDLDALPIDARPRPLPERVPFVGKRPAMTEAAPPR